MNTGNIKLTYKVIPLVLVGTLTALAVGFSLLINQFNALSYDNSELSKNLLSIEQQASETQQVLALESKTKILGKFLSSVAVDLILSSDFDSLIEYKKNAEEDPDIKYAEYLDPNSSPFVSFDKKVNQKDVFERKFRVESDGELLGFVVLGVMQKRVKISIAESEHRIREAVINVEMNAEKAYRSFLSILGFILAGIILMVIGTVYVAFKHLIISRLDHTTSLVEELSQGNGDLTRRIPLPNNDEISQLCKSVNKFVESLQNMVMKITKNVTQLSQESHSLEMQGQLLSEQALVQTDEAAITASSMKEMTMAMQEVFDSSGRAEELVSEADNEAQAGTVVVNETIKAITLLSSEITETSGVINSLQEESEKIGGVLEVIRGIAEQTNLLALNAAIEAARAGDQGRGFAVVADEVRTLASRTQAATEEINVMIENLQAGSKKAVAAMVGSTESAKLTVEQTQLADTSLQNIVAAVNKISEINSHIATSVESQKSVASVVGDSVSKINSISKKTEESASNTAEVCVILNTLASDLKEMVEQFKV